MREKGLPILDVEVGRSVRFAEATLSGESILTYAKNNPGAAAYRALAQLIDDAEKPQSPPSPLQTS
jgi:cellulose biosynthesis protein BcsQ